MKKTPGRISSEICVFTHIKNIKKIIKEQVKAQVKEQVTKILSRIEKTVNEQLEAEILSCLSNEAKTSHIVATNLSELELKKILIDKMESNNQSTDPINRRLSIKHWLTLMKVTNSYLTHLEIPSRLKDVEMIRMKTKYPWLDQTGGPREEDLEKNLNQQEPIHADEDLEETAHQEFDTGFTEDQPVDETTQHHDCNLAQKEDTRDSFNEQMDTPLDFSAFIMNRLKIDILTPELLVGPTFELIKGSCKSLVELEYFLEEVCKATTDKLDWNNPEGQQYPHDLRKPLPLIPNSQGRCVIPFDHFINNNLAYLRGGSSRRTYATSIMKTKAADYGHVKWIEDLALNNFYGFAVNRESARDVYSRHRIIAIIKLQIVEWHNYKHLVWITHCPSKGGDDLQLGVESYQKKLNLTTPDKYRSDLRRLPTYSAYLNPNLNPRGFKYQNKDKNNKLMCIDELRKFSDGTLNDVRTTLDDILKRIRMKYMPQTFWKKVDKDRAGFMI
ncbi:hypothetical protein Tco_0060863 [Tanacetum coccineum]